MGGACRVPDAEGRVLLQIALTLESAMLAGVLRLRRSARERSAQRRRCGGSRQRGRWIGWLLRSRLKAGADGRVYWSIGVQGSQGGEFN